MSGKNSNSGIIWKLVLTALVIVWAISAMIPFDDTPFEDYIKTRATAHQEEFAEVLATAEARIDKENYKNDPSKSPTLYIALRDYSDANEIDLFKYFPDVNVSDIKILKKRNDILLKELYRQSKGALKKGLDLQGGVSFTLQIDDSNLSSDSYARDGQLEDVLTVINNRINGLGISEPTIRIIGGNAIEVQMPGVSLKDNPEAIEELSRPAKLEFRLLHRTAVPSSMKPPLSEIPIGYELMVLESERGGKVEERPVYVKRIPEATGSIIKTAGVAMDNIDKYTITMQFTSEGSKVIERITSGIIEGDRSTNTKQGLGIVLDGRLLSAPGVSAVLTDGGVITGDFSRREALELANALNNPLSVGLKRTSLNEVGPSLATDARDNSLWAAAIATASVVIFMIIYYWGMGFIALLSVLVNIVILIGILASFGATMTLPGIAALVLTIGMAIDSNILVFERMREELKAGKNLWSALQLGYDRALATIIDANLTTLIIALILWYFGAGPVKGFGLTLAIGIFTTLFCALVLSKALLELAVKYKVLRNVLQVSIISNETKINFLNYAKPAFIISWIIVVCGILAIAYRGEKSLSIDFTGGDVVTVAFDPQKRIDIGDITSLSSATGDGLGEIQAAYKVDIATKAEQLTLQVEADKGPEVFDALIQKYPDAGLKLIAQQSIGATVSGEITRDAFIAMALSLMGMLVYIAFRFELSYGISAVIAEFHDLVMTIGLYVVFGLFGIGSGQFSAPMVAAVLMAIGYSINDKVVVFDRIREELTLKPNLSLREIINISVNRTLSRTLLTSATTFLVALALYIFATGIIVDFSLVFMIGVVVGTFSSIFIAAPVFYWWNKGSRAKVEKESVKTITKREWEA